MCGGAAIQNQLYHRQVIRIKIRSIWRLLASEVQYGAPEKAVPIISEDHYAEGTRVCVGPKTEDKARSQPPIGPHRNYRIKVSVSNHARIGTILQVLLPTSTTV